MKYYNLKIIAALWRLFYGWDKPPILFGRPEFVNPRFISFGDSVTINSFVYINATERVIIGNNVSLSAGCKLISTSLISEDLINGIKNHYNAKIIIGNNVQIGADAIVLPGCSICDNVVIGAKSLVNKNIKEPGVYVGTPARKIK